MLARLQKSAGTFFFAVDSYHRYPNIGLSKSLLRVVECSRESKISQFDILLGIQKH